MHKHYPYIWPLGRRGEGPTECPYIYLSTPQVILKVIMHIMELCPWQKVISCFELEHTGPAGEI